MISHCTPVSLSYLFLLLDRCNYSTKDGSDGYSSLSEAESACLSKGWSFPPDTKWKVEVIKHKTDQQGSNNAFVSIRYSFIRMCSLSSFRWALYLID